MYDKPLEQSIFHAALELATPAEREAYLRDACGNNEPLRAALAELLAAHERAGNILDLPPVAAVGTVAHEQLGTVIGPYKLLEQIGEGGFGVVYLAAQAAPVRRKVALKILKPGMDTRQVVARFEAERQALALMDHPNIAKVLDAGATSCGRPYFVMELVKGVPITEFCDQNLLGPRERLELFVSACSAVQHAHQKGIIHRDLKPSNVLVARYDEKPVPKVIDFGVAKAIGEPLTAETLHTGFWAVLGTLEYMSPEQASFNQLDIDTRSDIYSLGILLYELLTGTTPLEHKRAKEAGILEALRIVREEEAPTLNNRLSTLAEAAAIAARRGLEPAKLTKLMTGELNWIVMKALDKNRDRRYETATALAADIERYLSDEPVHACPPSAGYRLRKFVRRNKGAVLAATAGFLLLLAGITGTTWGLVGAEQAREAESRQRMQAEDAHKKAAREAAIATAMNDFLNKDILQLASATGQASRGVSPDANLKLSTVLQRAAKRIDGKFPNEPEVEMRLRYTIGYALLSVGDYASALPQFEKAAAISKELQGPDHAFTLMTEYRLAATHRHLRHFDLAVSLLEDNVARHKSALGPVHAQTFVSMNGLSMAYQAAGQTEKAVRLAEQNLELRKRHLGPIHADTLVSMNNVAALYREQKQPEKSLRLFEETLAGMQSTFAPLHPERINTTANLARAYHDAEQIDKAVPLEETAMQQFKTAHGLDYARTQQIIDNLIAYYVDVGWTGKAEALLTSIQSGGANRPTNVKESQDRREKRHRDLIQRISPAADKYQQLLAANKADHPDTLAARQAFAVVLRTRKRHVAAAYHLRAVLDARERLLPADHPDTHLCRAELGATRLQQKNYAAAEPLLLEAYAGLKQHETRNPEAANRSARVLQNLVRLYEGWDKKDKAMEWRKKLEEQK